MKRPKVAVGSGPEVGRTPGDTPPGAWFSARNAWPVALLAGLSTFLVYYATLAPDLAWDYYGADGAELITAAVTLGVPHPPGYPLYVLLGRLVAMVPLGTIAYRFNLFSAVCTAGAAAMAGTVAFFALQQTAPRSHVQSRSPAVPVIAATTAGLVVGLLPLVWQQALIAEVYGLNLLLLAALLLQLLRRGQEHNGWFAGLLLGLAVTSHLTSLFMAPLALLHTRRSRWPHLLLGAAAGASPYLLLPLLAAGESPVVWGDPATLQGWWWLVSAQLYRPNVLAPSQVDWAERIRLWSGELSVWFFVLATVFVAHNSRRLLPTARNSRVILLTTALVYALYALTYDADNALVYLLPGLLLVAVFMVHTYFRVGPLALLLPLALLMLNFNRLDLSDQQEARRLASSPLREAPPGALVVTDGDRATFTLWYLQHVEGMRSDLVLVDQNLLAFDWYRRRLQRRHPDLQQLEVDDLAQFRQANQIDRSLCTVRIADVPAPTVVFYCLEA